MACHLIARLPEIRCSTRIPRNDPFLLPRQVLIHTSQPRIYLVTQQPFTKLMNMLGPFLDLERVRKAMAREDLLTFSPVGSI